MAYFVRLFISYRFRSQRKAFWKHLTEACVNFELQCCCIIFGFDADNRAPLVLSFFDSLILFLSILKTSFWLLEKCHLVQDGHSETRGEAPSVFGWCGHCHSGHGIGWGRLRTSSTACSLIWGCGGLYRPLRTCACCRRSGSKIGFDTDYLNSN